MEVTEDPDNIVPFSPAPDESFETAEPIASAAAAPASGGGSGGKTPPPASPPAAAAPDDGPPDPAEAFTSKRGDEEYFFDEDSKQFLRKNDAGAWIGLGQGDFILHLKKQHGLRDKPLPGKLTSAAHDVVWDVQNNRRVSYAGLIAGYKSGVHVIGGRRVLVTDEPVLIEPSKGEWPLYAKVLEGLFVGTEETGADGKTIEIDQRPWVFAWLQHLARCAYSGRTDSGLMFGLAGDPNCGKSFFALTVEWMTGGRSAKCYKYMMGDDSFNRDLVESPIWLIDDENQADTNYQARQRFGGEVKMVTANNSFRVRAMHTNPFAIPLLRRLMVLCNLQGTRLLVFPPLDGDVDDKMHLFKGYVRPAPAAPITIETPAEQACWPMPMPTRTPEEREAFRAAIRAELPAFLWWLLNEYKMPSHVSAGARFGSEVSYRHPAIVAALQEHSPCVRLWDLIVRSRVVFEHYEPGDSQTVARRTLRTEWRGSAGDLETLLKKDSASDLSKEERAEIKAANYLGRTLDLCRQHFGAKYCRQERTRDGRFWILTARTEDVHAIERLQA